MSFKVVIPTAGTGSRLGSLTKHLNKALVSVGHRPVIARQIEKFPPDCEFVIALGAKGELVRQFLNIVYPKRRFQYVVVDIFEGQGSGLGHSLRCCRAYLQQPFVFLSCDTLVVEKIPDPNENWMGYADSNNFGSYRTLEISDLSVRSIREKDFSGFEKRYPYVGLCGVRDYEIFWDAMFSEERESTVAGESHGLLKLLEKERIRAHQFTWFDTGSVEALGRACEAFRDPKGPNVLPKESEAIWFINDKVIKFSADKTFIENRVARASELRGFVPHILQRTDNMYCYQKVEGRILSEVIDPPLFEKLLHYSKTFWTPIGSHGRNSSTFKSKCYAFYYKKTIERVELFYQIFSKQDGTESINGTAMPLLSELLDLIDWDQLCDGIPVRFHGDFHFENILWNEKANRFIFLDWRQDFAGDLIEGDVYYDLSKLMHGLFVPHDLIVNDKFEIEWNKDRIFFSLLRKRSLIECQRLLEEWCAKNGYDISRVRILTALIFLNIAALHHFPYGLLLFAFGKLLLKRELDRIGAIKTRQCLDTS